MIALLKALHISGLAVWCAGLILLPVMMHRHGRHPEMQTQAGFAEFRWLTHYGYTRVVSPAAVVTVVAGTGLIFAGTVIDLWMIAKLVAVTGMVLLHAWLGHLIVVTGEAYGRFRVPPVGLTLLVILPLIGMVLWLVLAKPSLEDLTAWFPDFLQTPLDRPIPERFTPI